MRSFLPSFDGLETILGLILLEIGGRPNPSLLITKQDLGRQSVVEQE